MAKVKWLHIYKYNIKGYFKDKIYTIMFYLYFTGRCISVIVYLICFLLCIRLLCWVCLSQHGDLKHVYIYVLNSLKLGKSLHFV